jgi:hypothetical protein
MEFSENTKHKISLLNTVLDGLRVQRLFENPDFIADMDSAGYHRVVIDVFSGSKRTAPLTLYLQGDSIRLDICGIVEAFEWSNEDVFKSRVKIVDFFTKLFTSYLLVESCGSVGLKSRMYLFNKDGDFIEKFALRGFVHRYSGWDCDKHLFLPLY